MSGPKLGHDSIIQPPTIKISDLFHWEKDSPPVERLVEGPLDDGCGIQRNAVTRF
jgi:hypothetical protein